MGQNPQTSFGVSARVCACSLVSLHVFTCVHASVCTSCGSRVCAWLYTCMCVCAVCICVCKNVYGALTSV